VDPYAVEVDSGDTARVAFAVGDTLGDALVRPGRVVVRLVFGQHADVARRGSACGPRARGAGCPTRRSQIVFMRGAGTALRRILVPVAWKTAPKERVKFDPRSRMRNLMSSNRSSRSRARLRACWPGPLSGGMCGDAAEMHPAGAVLDEDQYVQSLQQHGVPVQEGRPRGATRRTLGPAQAVLALLASMTAAGSSRSSNSAVWRACDHVIPRSLKIILTVI
jgi:hypothetical protein